MPKSSTTPYLARCAVHGGRSSIGTYFRGNTQITSFNEFEFFTGVTSMEGSNAFYGSSNLAEIIIPENMVNLGGTTFRGTKLVEVVIPEKVTKIGTRCFAFCSNLTTITMLPTTPPTIDNTTFQSSNALTHIYVPEESLTAYKTASYWSDLASKIFAIQE